MKLFFSAAGTCSVEHALKVHHCREFFLFTSTVSMHICNSSLLYFRALRENNICFNASSHVGLSSPANVYMHGFDRIYCRSATISFNSKLHSCTGKLESTWGLSFHTLLLAIRLIIRQNFDPLMLNYFIN